MGLKNISQWLKFSPLTQLSKLPYYIHISSYLNTTDILLSVTGSIECCQSVLYSPVNKSADLLGNSNDNFSSPFLKLKLIGVRMLSINVSSSPKSI